jgi:hypothetical protein
MSNKLDKQLQVVRDLEHEKRGIEEQLKVEREYLEELMNIDEIDTYKSTYGTASIVRRQDLKIKDKDSFLKYLKDNRKTEYIEIVPEHEEIQTKKLREDLSKGVLKELEGIELETSESIRIRF